MNANSGNDPQASPARRALALGIAIERHNATCFAAWADRFRAYDTAVAEFLDALVEEEREHERQLATLYHDTFDEPVPSTDTKLPDELNQYIPDFDAFGEHFFITDTWAAYTLLNTALDIERFTRRFYAELLEQTKDPAQAEMYRQLSAFEEEHERAFEAQLAKLEQPGN